MSNNQIQPIFILPEGSQRTSGKNAQRMNILAAKMVAETVRTTLGPKGMDKMVVDSLGDVIVTNDGATILQEINIEHPTAKMIVEVAKTQENEVGDGTTTAVVIAGELLKNAEILIEQNVHPTTIVKGYRLAAEESQKILKNLSQKITEKDVDLIKKIGITAMTGKGAETSKEYLADLATRAIKRVISKNSDGEIIVEKNNINIEKKVGESINSSELIEGIALDKERVHSGMPKYVKNARIALIDSAIEIKSPETDTKIQITDPNQMQAFLNQEEAMLKDMVEKIEKSGANVLICQKGIDDIAQHFLAKKQIFAIRRAKKSDMENLSKSTGARIVTNLDDLSKRDIGFAGMVEEMRVGDEEMTYVKECKSPKAVTILLRGGTEHIVDEIKRAMEDVIGDISSALNTNRVVGGAGAPEIEVAKGLRKYSNSLSGRQQLAVQAFADAVEVIPKTLAENAGLDPIDIITDLKSAHDKGNKWAGIDVFSGKIIDAWKKGIIEPWKIKSQAISSASEVSDMILRIDDVIAGSSGRSGEPEMPPGVGGMGGMPPPM